MVKIVEKNEDNMQVDFALGDFNTFLDNGGVDQIRLIESEMINLSENINETFTSFPGDLNPDTGEPFRSKLDHIFGKFRETIDYSSKVTSINFSESKISDHYPLIMDLEF